MTFGKALGVHGAIVLGPDLLKQGLINFSTPSIYTTALPFYSLAAIKCSYDLFPTMESERQHINHLVSLQLSPSKTQIQSIAIEGNEAVRHASETLAFCGFDIKPLMSPTVQRGKESLRICLHAFNTKEQIETLITHTGGNFG